MSIAFVLGNGRSRLNVNPEKLKKHGKLYGCNALYRDCVPDFLIAVDPKMVVELDSKKIQDITTVWTNPNSKYKNYKNLNFFSPSKGWSSGPTALWLASTHGYEQIYILGFDYQGVEGKFFNNVYADTQNYKRSTEPPTFYGNWQRQTETVLKEFPKIRYTRVVDDAHLDFNWSEHKNYETINYKEFKNKFGIQN